MLNCDGNYDHDSMDLCLRFHVILLALLPHIIHWNEIDSNNFKTDEEAKFTFLSSLCIPLSCISLIHFRYTWEHFDSSISIYKMYFRMKSNYLIDETFFKFKILQRKERICLISFWMKNRFDFCSKYYTKKLEYLLTDISKECWQILQNALHSFQITYWFP